MQRGFKIGLNFKPIFFTAPLEDPQIRNRKHDGTEYNFSSMISKWIVVSNGLVKNMGDNITDQQLVAHMNQIKPAWPQMENGQTEISIIPLNCFLKNQDIKLIFLLKYLLDFMASYSGLGAKINQGWGIFSVDDNEGMREAHSSGVDELRKLIDVCNYSTDPENILPRADDCFAATWTLRNANLGLIWPNRRIPHDKPYLCTGFAMTYRLRRYMKFYENDNPFKKIFALHSQPWEKDWRDLGNQLPGKWSKTKWKETIPYIRVLFGRDDLDENTKTSGLVGISHLYKENDSWHVRLSGRIPLDCCYRAWDNQNQKDISTWLNWDANVVRTGIINRFQELLTSREIWTHGDAYILRTGGDL